MVTVCCVCNRTKGWGGWYYANIPNGIILSHGYCPDCKAGLETKIEEWSAARVAKNHSQVQPSTRGSV